MPGRPTTDMSAEDAAARSQGFSAMRADTPGISGDDDDTGSQGMHSVLDDILDQYRFHWEPEYRVKFKKELSGFSLGVAISKPHEVPARLRLTLKPLPQRPGEANGGSCVRRLGASCIQKVLLMPQQHFAALYSRKLPLLGFLRCQFVAGYFWDRRCPSLDYRISTKWNEGLRFKRKEYYQPTSNLLIRAKWNLDMQLPDVEGHLGGGEGSTQVPMDVEYGNLDFSVTQLDWVCDLDGIKEPSRAVASVCEPCVTVATKPLAQLPAASQSPQQQAADVGTGTGVGVGAWAGVRRPAAALTQSSAVSTRPGAVGSPPVWMQGLKWPWQTN